LGKETLYLVQLHREGPTDILREEETRRGAARILSKYEKELLEGEAGSVVQKAAF